MTRISMSVLAAGCTLLFAAGGMAQTSGQSQQQAQQQPAAQQGQEQYVQQFMVPDKFKDLKVQDAQGKEVGSIDQVVLDAREGRIGFVIVKANGIMGGGDRKIVPWSAFKFQAPAQGAKQEEKQQPVLVLNVPKEQLMAAPEGDVEKALDRRYAALVHQYYGVTPYWEESQAPQGARQPPMQPPQQTPGQQQPMQPSPPPAQPSTQPPPASGQQL